MRTDLKSQQYWDDLLLQLQGSIDRFVISASEPNQQPEDRLRRTMATATRFRRMAIAQYSSGAPVAVMRATFLEYLKWYSMSTEIGLKIPTYFQAEYTGSANYFSDLSLCYLFDLQPQNCESIVRRIDFFDYQDSLLETFITAIGFNNRLAATSLIWPEAYEYLQAANTSPDPKNTENLKIFIEGWYTSMKDCGWYDSHKSNHDVFYGYWCFEAAAIAKLRGIDITTIQDHPEFPIDLLH